MLFRSNLLSVHKLCLQNNAFCYFDAYKFSIQDLPSGKILYKGLNKDGVYPIPSPSTLSSSSAFNCKSTISASNSIKSDVLLLWHYSYEIAKYDDNLFLVILLTPVLNVPNAKIKSQFFVNSLSSLLTLSH